MTEDQTDEKWCPMVRMSSIGYGHTQNGWNREFNHHDDEKSLLLYQGTHCIGSRCMMWRWIDKRTEYGEQLKPTSGYCGLAGKP